MSRTKTLATARPAADFPTRYRDAATRLSVILDALEREVEAVRRIDADVLVAYDGVDDCQIWAGAAAVLAQFDRFGIVV